MDRVAIAIAAHPDDIEFMMSGTLLLLRKAGYETHYLNIASGSCGSSTLTPAQTRRTRARESADAARILEARHHGSLVDDLEIFYTGELLARVTSIIRKVKPTVVLTHSLHDYMEDHMNTARLAVSAAFCRGMKNFATRPACKPFEGEITLYHALPHGLRDEMGRPVIPESFVNVTSVTKTRTNALAAHASQQAWLSSTQRMPSLLDQLEATTRTVGRMSRKFRFAEGWRRHNHLGLCAADADPLRDALGPLYRRNPDYTRLLRTPRI